ncbi:MAG: SprB repeat-containing protein, partial [Bacteroidetes bacterium]|nr:SprB repeat-containing protein [Bacteroidota bacterium]
GTATVTAAGGTPAYTYLWNNGQTTSTATGLIAGNNTVTITDAKGCTTTSIVSITQPAAALSYSTSQINVFCFGGSNGTATVTAAGGTPAYTYIWSDGQTTSSATGLLAGNYFVTITDAKGCTTSAGFAITEPVILSSASSQTNVSCFGGNDGTAAVTAAGGTPPYSYLWNNGETDSSAGAVGSGSYTVTVTDANGCTSTASASISQPTLLSSLITAADVSCLGGNNGSASVTVSGGTPAYTYLWSSGQTTSAISGLTAGIYTATVTDANGCSLTQTDSLSQPSSALASSVNQTNVSCFGGSDGTAAVTAAGGTPSYTYLWGDGQTTSTISGLTEGNYIAVVTDANGCTITNTFSITQPAAPLSSSASQNNVSCYGGSDGTAAVAVTGGSPPYFYLWSNGDTDSVAVAVAVGSYTVTITDANGCTITDTFSITQPATPLFSSALQNNVSCFGGSNGSATVFAAGGTPSYTFAWSNGENQSAIDSLQSAVYTVTITDANGCTITNTYSITQPAAPLSSSASQNNVSCFGGSDGSATVAAAGGTPPYSYLWSNGETDSTAGAVGSGSYTVTVTDANGCTITGTFSITEPAAQLSSSASQNNVSCFGGSDGSATVAAAGGTPPYSYLWNNGDTDSAAVAVGNGSYIVTITDANGCTITDTFSITQPAAPLFSSAIQNNVSCFGGSNGSATVFAAGGTPPYAYAWSNGENQSAIDSLSASGGGIYTVTVTDANGCTDVTTIVITQPAVLTSATTQTNACSGSSSGLANIFASGGTPAYSYSWSNGQSASSATGLSAGNYSVTITDANGCTLTTTITILFFPALFSTTFQTNVSCYGGSDGSATDSAFGGTPPFSYLWSNGASQSAIGNLQSAIYTVTVTDSNGCTVADTVTITEPMILVASASATAAGCSACTGTSTANASGGTPPYYYL